MFQKTRDPLQRPVRGFLLSVPFAGLVFLAFNPMLVVDLQERFNLSQRDVTIERIEPDTPISLVPEFEGLVEVDDVDVGPTDVGLPDVETPVIENKAKVQTPAETPPLMPLRGGVIPTTAKPDINNLPRIDGFVLIEEDDLWVGDMSCGEDIFDLPVTLSGVGPRRNGTLFTESMETIDSEDIRNQPTYLYKSENGVILRVVDPVVKYYPAYGRRFRDAHKDIIDRKPLDSLQDQTTEGELGATQDKKTATLANISSPTLLTFTSYGSRDHFRLMTGKTMLTAAFIVTLPRWTTYDIASPDEKAKWDDMICNAAHHELGHLRIRLDILAETLDGYAALPSATSSKALEALTTDYRADINASVNERQDAYHIFNGDGIRRGMTEVPYAELPLPWIEDAQNAD